MNNPFRQDAHLDRFIAKDSGALIPARTKIHFVNLVGRTEKIKFLPRSLRTII
jgi:hypothetical protein